MDHESIAHQLGKNGRCIYPNFISPELAHDLREDLNQIRISGEFKQGGVGQGKDHSVRNQVRRDEIFWLNEGTVNPVQQLLWNQLALLKQAFNRTLYLGLTKFEGHYASYPNSGFYKRHLDCFQRDDARMVSIILYLNHNWKAADGGRLRIYENGSHVDIDPIDGTLVCFLSRELEHEVLLSHAARNSFVGWFKTPPPRKAVQSDFAVM